ncbi:MAG: hypothetical protein L0228_07245 [Planctomycetes bacterium]|nr:hypothetical protein [Planctomycetota bacterium]
MPFPRPQKPTFVAFRQIASTFTMSVSPELCASPVLVARGANCRKTMKD